MDGWRPGGRPVLRNVLLERVEMTPSPRRTGELVVRPFRGLRRYRP